MTLRLILFFGLINLALGAYKGYAPLVLVGAGMIACGLLWHRNSDPEL